jgi:hypothetical protein
VKKIGINILLQRHLLKRQSEYSAFVACATSSDSRADFDEDGFVVGDVEKTDHLEFVVHLEFSWSSHWGCKDHNGQGESQVEVEATAVVSDDGDDEIQCDVELTCDIPSRREMEPEEF